jgi:hypothetical protein
MDAIIHHRHRPPTPASCRLFFPLLGVLEWIRFFSSRPTNPKIAALVDADGMGAVLFYELIRRSGVIFVVSLRWPQQPPVDWSEALFLLVTSHHITWLVVVLVVVY